MVFSELWNSIISYPIIAVVAINLMTIFVPLVLRDAGKVLSLLAKLSGQEFLCEVTYLHGCLTAFFQAFLPG